MEHGVAKADEPRHLTRAHHGELLPAARRVLVGAVHLEVGRGEGRLVHGRDLPQQIEGLHVDRTHHVRRGHLLGVCDKVVQVVLEGRVAEGEHEEARPCRCGQLERRVERAVEHDARVYYLPRCR
jgi:hypothetical protein